MMEEKSQENILSFDSEMSVEKAKDAKKTIKRFRGKSGEKISKIMNF